MAQGTIKTYDGSSRSGLILDDAANEFAFDGTSFEGSGIRLFRIGQRVRFSLVGEGDRAKVRDLTILTL